jgi:CTP:molybdopterin cytidylyltransferase MocA
MISKEGASLFAAASASHRLRPIEAVDAILPAGGRLSGEFARLVATEVKALVQLNGQTILRRAIEALQATGRVRRCLVIGPEEARAEAKGCGAETLPEGATGPENVFLGLESLQAAPRPAAARVLIVATDLPFLTAASLTEFLDACPQEADVAVPILTAETFETRFPGSPNTYTRLREGPVTLGGAFLINPAVLLGRRDHLERVFAARKSSLAMAKLLGPEFILRYLTGRLAVRHIEARCSRILGCAGRAVLEAPPELAYDIDLPEEYHYAVQWMSSVGNTRK